MRAIHRVERLCNLNALVVLGVPLDQREATLAALRQRCYLEAIDSGMAQRNAKRQAEKTERMTRAIVEILQLRL